MLHQFVAQLAAATVSHHDMRIVAQRQRTDQAIHVDSWGRILIGFYNGFNHNRSN